MGVKKTLATENGYNKIGLKQNRNLKQEIETNNIHVKGKLRIKMHSWTIKQALKLT